MSDIVERLRSQSILKVWHPMMLEAADEIDRQRKVISAMIEDCQYLKDKQIEAAAEIEKLERLATQALKEASQLRAELAAERERCARIVENYDLNEGYEDISDALFNICKAIRETNG